MKHRESLVMVWGEQPPIFSIGYEPPTDPHDSGFTILFDDAPDPADVTADDPRLTWVCLHCVVNEHPEIGRGLDLAKTHGAADLSDGEWAGRRVEPLTDSPMTVKSSLGSRSA